MHELAPIPTSLFQDDGYMCPPTAKATLTKTAYILSIHCDQWKNLMLYWMAVQYFGLSHGLCQVTYNTWLMLWLSMSITDYFIVIYILSSTGMTHIVPRAAQELKELRFVLVSNITLHCSPHSHHNL